MDRSLPLARHRAGITLTEILIAILILGVGLASLATLFPLGLLRLREATRSTRAAYLMESAAADVVARGLVTSSSFSLADLYNLNNNLTPWYTILSGGSTTLTYPYAWNPMTQDQGYYLDDPRDTSTPGVPGNLVGLPSGNYGLPFAYDPLWRFQTVSPTTGAPGYYIGDALEARFGAGLGFIRNDPSGDGLPPSAHGLQRVTNFNRPYVLNAGNQQVPIMPAASVVPTIFVSPEDVVWQEPNNQQYLLGVPGIPAIAVGTAPSPLVPDLSISVDANNNRTYQPVIDWHYSWMFTGQQNNGSSGSTFEGNIVIFENRLFGITDATNTAPNPPGGVYQAYQIDGEMVVEAIFGYSNTIAPVGGPGFGASADRAVLLRWYASQNDPAVKVGDWIADVTYERNASAVQSRFLGYALAAGGTGGLANPFNNFEWDNLPAQRCYWYRVQKVIPATADSVAGLRSMVVYVDRTLQARTVLTATGPMPLNAALICPSVVNVIPQTIFTR